MLTLATFTIPTGLRAWVEDVVVDAGARGQGAGLALVEAAVAHAQELGAPDGGPDLPPVPRGRQPPVPAGRVLAARDERLPLRREVTRGPGSPGPAPA